MTLAGTEQSEVINQKFSILRILAADELDQAALDFIDQQPGVELTSKPGLREEQLAEIIGDYDAMIVRSGVQVTARILDHPGRLKVIARAGVGVDNIDIDIATAKGILVVNSAEASTLSAAEHCFALLLALSRHIAAASLSMTEGRWDRSGFKGHQLAGKTLGLVGMGRIGQAVAQRACAFDMKVLAYDPFYNAPTALDGKVRMFNDFRKLLPQVDILTFHVPLNDQTRGMLDAEALAQSRRGVLIINVARGGIVDEQALIESINLGQCGGAAIDVFETEPPPTDSPLRKHPKVLLTPHLGASTIEAQQAVSIDAARSTIAYLRGEGIHGAVNVTGLQLDLDPMQQCFVDLASRMAQLISPMVTQGFGTVTIELTGRPLTAAANMIECTALVGLLGSHLNTPLNLVNARHIASHRGIKIRTITADDDRLAGEQIAIEIRPSADQGARRRRIVGRVYHDMRPRVIDINGYHMDMVPAGFMVLLQNHDLPGMVGVVGTEFGQAKINIADMAISRRDQTALMLLKVDQPPPDALLTRLKLRPGILNAVLVKLPAEISRSQSPPNH